MRQASFLAFRHAVALICLSLPHGSHEASGGLLSAALEIDEYIQFGLACRCAQDKDAVGVSKEDEAKEKQRLQDMVGSFAKRAVQGIACKVLDEDSGEWRATEYRLDGRLEKLTFLKPGTKVTQASCRVASIEDIYTHSNDGDAPFPNSALIGISFEERDALAMIIGSRGEGLSTFRFLLIESSAAALDTFMECMRVLVAISGVVSRRFVHRRTNTNLTRSETGRFRSMAPACGPQSLHA